MASSRLLVAALLGITMPGSAFADYAYVTNQSSSNLSVIDLDRLVEVGRIPVPGQPAGIAVAPELGAVFTVSPDSKMLRRFGLTAGRSASRSTSGAAGFSCRTGTMRGSLCSPPAALPL